MPAVAELLHVATGAPGLLRRLAEADSGLRRPVPTSRRLSLVQADGGAGATVTTARLGSALSARRSGAVLAVDAAGGRARLAAAAAVDRPPSLSHTARRSAGITRAVQARELAPRSRSGLLVIGTGTAESAVLTSTGEWHAAVDLVGRFFDVVLTDWGVRPPGDLTEISAASHVVAVVARADRGPAERGLALAEQVTADGTAPAVLLLVDLGGTAGGTARVLERSTAVPVLRVPHVPTLGTGHVTTARVALDARAAYAGAAALLLRTSVGAAA